MAVIVNGDGILSGVSSLTTDLTDITSGRGTVTGVATVGTLQLGAGVSISSPRSQTAAIFTNNTEFLTVDDAGRVGVGTITPNSDAHPENEKKINVGFVTAKSIAGDIDARNVVVAGVSTFVGALNAAAVSGTTGTFSSDVSVAGDFQVPDVIKHEGDVNTKIRFPAADTFTVETAGSERFRIISTGEVGINMTPSNGQMLAITGRSGYDDVVQITSVGTNIGARINLTNTGTGVARINATNNSLELQTGGTNRLHIDSAGKIGVNVTSSTGQFVVKNSDDSNLNVLEVYNDNGNRTGGFSQSSAGDGTISAQKNDGTISAFFRSNGVSYLTGGNFGLGTNSPSTLLHLSGSGPRITFTDTAGTNDISKITGSAGALYLQARDGDAHGEIIFRTENNATAVERMRIKNDGDISINTGNLVIGTSGKGIDFSATANSSGSMGSELLDDYEEGTFTPTQPTIGTNSASGTYTKIGRYVYASIFMTLPTNSSGVAFYIDDLPFTALNNSGTNIHGGYAIYSTYGSPFTVRVHDNATRAQVSAIGGNNITLSGLDNLNFRIQVHYMTN